MRVWGSLFRTLSLIQCGSVTRESEGGYGCWGQAHRKDCESNTLQDLAHSVIMTAELFDHPWSLMIDGKPKQAFYDSGENSYACLLYNQFCEDSKSNHSYTHAHSSIHWATL